MAPLRFLTSVAAQLGIHGMDRDVKRGKSLVDHPLQVELGEPRQRGEVPIQERKAVVVVLQIQALSHPFRQLVDEAEVAMVVAGPHSVEHRGGDLDTHRLAGGLRDLQDDLFVAPADGELRVGLVGEHLVLDHVARDASVDRDDLVPDGETGLLSRGRSCHRDDPGRRHA